jgi:hypothetical protein
MPLCLWPGFLDDYSLRWRVCRVVCFTSPRPNSGSPEFGIMDAKPDVSDFALGTMEVATQSRMDFVPIMQASGRCAGRVRR